MDSNDFFKLAKTLVGTPEAKDKIFDKFKQGVSEERVSEYDLSYALGYLSTLEDNNKTVIDLLTYIAPAAKKPMAIFEKAESYTNGDKLLDITLKTIDNPNFALTVMQQDPSISLFFLSFYNDKISDEQLAVIVDKFLQTNVLDVEYGRQVYNLVNEHSHMFSNPAFEKMIISMIKSNVVDDPLRMYASDKERFDEQNIRAATLERFEKDFSYISDMSQYNIFNFKEPSDLEKRVLDVVLKKDATTIDPNLYIDTTFFLAECLAKDSSRKDEIFSFLNSLIAQSSGSFKQRHIFKELGSAVLYPKYASEVMSLVENNQIVEGAELSVLALLGNMNHHKEHVDSVHKLITADDRYKNTLSSDYIEVLIATAALDGKYTKDVFKRLNDVLDEISPSSNASIETSFSLALIQSSRRFPEFRTNLFEPTVTLVNKARTSDRLSNFCSVMQNILPEIPERAEEVFEVLAQKDFSVFNASHIHKIRELTQSVPELRAIVAKNIANINNENLNFIYKTRYSSDAEFKFILHNDIASFPMFKIKGFSQQQRALNVILDMVEGNYASKTFREGRMEGIEDWMIPASFGLSATFGKFFPSYLKKATQHMSVHDATYWLPYDLPETKAASLASFIDRNLIYDKQGKKNIRYISEMEVIAKNWKGLKPEQEKLPFKDILHICRSRKYDDQRYDDFAIEASKWGVSEREYKDYEDMYHAGLKVPTPFATDKEFKSGELTGKFLPRDDVRVGFFGNHTDCCQHFDGMGKTCAISSVMDSYSQLFVIEDKKGSIIAGSWVWTNEDNGKKAVCFDNIEAKGEYIKSAKLNDIYEQVGDYVTKDAGYAKATIGGGYQDAYIDNYKKTDSVELPKPYGSGYTDAHTQYLLSENEKAPEVKEESLRYIRDAISLDIDDMESVSEQCFPASDRGLQIPEEVNGLVLVDEESGIVGYALFDDEEKSIYDMAVLKGYRTDKNASSKKLLAEVAKHVREQGGEWSAQLRDQTSLRYMQAMAERGIIELDVGNVHHEMSDGSKVYNVSFSVADAKQTQTKQNDGVAKNLMQRVNFRG